MAVEAHCLLPVRGSGVVADPTESETKQRHGDCVADLASTPHGAVGPPAYVVLAPGREEAESGGGAFFANAAASSRKRARGPEDRFVGAAKRRVIDVHHPAVLHHVQRLNAEVQQWRRYAAALNAAVARQLRTKDEEIDAARCLNWLLQEQARAAHAEAQAWRDAALSGEAAAAALRADLDDALRALARRARDEAGSSTAEDAESCCSGGNNSNGEEGDDDATTGSSVAGACRGCGDRDAAVVLLPCRHLSACAPCAAAARTCPACGFPIAGSVAVNLV